MFYKFNTDGRGLVRILKSFEIQAEYLKHYRARCRLSLIFSGALAVACLLFTWVRYSSSAAVAFAFALEIAAFLFVFFALTLEALLRRLPGRGHPILWALALPLFAAFIATVFRLKALAPQSLPMREVAFYSWLAATFFVFCITQHRRWRRLASAVVQDAELLYLKRLLLPLTSDLPVETKFTLSCNPYPDIWSQRAVKALERPGYDYRAYEDEILRLKLKLDDGFALLLGTFHYRVDKYKSRKNKYKGSKHRVVQAYKFEHPALSNALRPQEQMERLREACAKLLRESVASGDSSYESHVTIQGSLLDVSQVGKHLGTKQFKTGYFPDAGVTLQTIRLVTGFIAASDK